MSISINDLYLLQQHNLMSKKYLTEKETAELKMINLLLSKTRTRYQAPKPKLSIFKKMRMFYEEVFCDEYSNNFPN